MHDLLPHNVEVCVLGPEDVPDPLHPVEAGEVARALPVRVREFSLGRTCARRVLTRLGHPDVPIPKGERGAPVWPEGVVGAITHTRSVFAAIAARRTDWRSVGLDAEVVGRVKPELWTTLFQPAERAWLASLPPDDRALRATLHFSARETFYKVQFPVCRQWVDFLDVDLTSEGDTFEVVARAPIAGFCGAGARFRGRWGLRGDTVVSTLVL